MIVVYKKTERVKVEIGEITLHLAPLNYDEKAAISSCLINQGGIVNQDALKAAFLSIKYSVKEVEGLFLSDGTAYKLEFDGQSLSDDCVNELMNLPITSDIIVACTQLVNGIPAEIVDPETGKPSKKVKLILPNSGMKVKKK